MTQLTWDTAAEWDAAASEYNVHHEQPTGTSWAAADTVELGWPTILDSLYSATPLAYYPLEEASGATTANEVTGSGTNGTYNGTTTGNAGILGFNAPTFDGVDDYVDSGSMYSSANDAMGISAWVKKSAWSTSWENICNNWNGTNGGARMQRDSTNNYLRFAITHVVVTGSIDIADGAWHHVHGQGVSGGDFELYVDGALDGSTSTTDSTDTAIVNSNHYIASQPGSDGAGYNFWDGQIAEVVIWDGTLTSSEVSELAALTGGRLISAGKTS